MPAGKQPVFQRWQPSGVNNGGMFSNTNSQEAPLESMAFVNDFYIDGGQWVGRDNGTALVTGLTGTVNSIDYVRLFNAGVYHSYIVWSQSDGKVFQSPGSLGGTTQIATGIGVNPLIFRNVKNRVYCANGSTLPFIFSATFGKSTWGVVAQSTVLARDLSSSGVPYYATGTIAVTNASNAIVGTGTTFTGAMVGQPMYILGVRYIVGSFTNATNITITQNYQAATSASIAADTGSPPTLNGWHINTGTMSWTQGNGLRYAVSYYDPVTGHSSNISPILDVSDVGQLADATTVKITGIIVTSDPRFTQIIIWRTAHGGGILFPLNVISNTGASPTTYTDTNNSDTVLGTLVLGTFPAPILTNAPPPVDLNYQAYWDGRFWGASTANPGLLYYSARNDPSEITVGVAEECWPAINTIPVQDNDGVITGTRLVGSNLYVMTGAKIYVVLGNSPANYVMQPLSSKGRGTVHFACAELPGEDVNSADVLIHAGNDGHIYFLYGPGGDVSYSYQIQDQLRPAFTNSMASNYIVSTFHSIKNTYVVVQSNATAEAFFFDIDRKVWFFMSLTNLTAMGEGFTDRDGSCFFYGTSGGSIIKLTLSDNAAPLPNSYYLQTQLQNPKGAARGDPKNLQFFEVIGTGFTPSNIQVQCAVDGGTPVTLVQSTGTAKQVFSEPNQLDYIPPSGVLPGLVFTFSILFTSTLGIPKIAALEADWTVTEEEHGVQGEF